MKFSFETPLSILEKSREFNDFDYFLDILYEENNSIIEFFLDSINQGRRVFLDNSLYERKVRNIEFNEDSFKYLISLLNNRIEDDKKHLLHIIVPDFYEDSNRCIRKVNEYLELYPSNTIVAVVHGHSKQDFKRCFNEYHKILRESDVIAVSGGDMCCRITPRSDILLEIFKDSQDSKNLRNRRIHFLGLVEPIEVLQILRVSHLIESIDTSYPIISTIEDNIIFNNREKPKTLILDVFNDYIFEDYKLLESNIELFKSIFK